MFAAATTRFAAISSYQCLISAYSYRCRNFEEGEKGSGLKENDNFNNRSYQLLNRLALFV